MSDDQPSKPTLSPAGALEAEERRQRQARALRANLARRKARDRALEAAVPPSGAAPGPLESQDVPPPPARKPGGA
ncbi:MAG: hypothetical protein L6R19_13235 [Alphaproteobacteria bacterium]|nr:hypothetical protein [Alphaproteobacteria bacterium]